ncbi:MAG: 50S ribosomal protein L19e [Candidatus Wukongarchaeota archaeon]|nr:50S ribosomal protein L19e [Candidatus Wukongarchaeota archaeon]
MSLRPQRRIAADILGVGENRVFIQPEFVDEVSLALTRADLKKLVYDGIIRVRPVRGVSRGRARRFHEKRKKGLRRGSGSRKGAKTARMPRKRSWMFRIRAQRRFLRELRDSRSVTPNTYRMLYKKAKGGTFKSVNALKMYIEEHKLYAKRKERKR